ncbi:MAG: hypothetical protein HWE27_07345 [Gammaproteobacteria bacterium]|nr:hypothetical protein [Gammaproteobacteria bacterium]
MGLFRRAWAQLSHMSKDLIILVLGIYLALWMENTVQDWEELDKQQDYLSRLAEDISVDQQHIKSVVTFLEKKIDRVSSGISFLQNSKLDPLEPETQSKALELGSVVNNYYFFTPQDFTYLSMRESGDFKLIRSNTLKSKLIRLYGRYKLVDTLQKNYLQGLDDEFIPFWMRNVDMLSQELSNPDIVTEPLFRNMIAFAGNDTQTRLSVLNKLTLEVNELANELKRYQEESL